MRKAALLAVLALFAVQAHAQGKKQKVPPPVNSVSVTAPLDKIKASIAQLAAEDGYLVDSDSAYQMTISKNEKPNFGVVMQYGAHATIRTVLHFQFVSDGDSTKLIGTSEAIIAPEYGSEKRVQHTDEPSLRYVEKSLLRIRDLASGIGIAL